MANSPITKAQEVIDHASTKARTKGTLTTTYERFLELPVPVVLLVMWVVGATLIGGCVLLIAVAF